MSAAEPARPARRGAFSPMVMIALVLVSVFAFSAYMVLGAFESQLTSGRDGRAHALSQSAVGFAAAVDLARANGVDVSVGRDALDATRYDSLVVLTPEHPISVDELYDASGQTTLIVLPKWIVAGHPIRRGWVTRVDPLDHQFVAHVMSEVAPDLRVVQDEGESQPRLKVGAGFRAGGAIEHLQTMSGGGLSPVAVDQQGRRVLGQLKGDGYGLVYVLADPDFLNTQGLADADTARAGLALLEAVREEGQPIVFDVTLNGLGASRSALRLAFEPPFLGATLGLAIAAALLGWRAALRAGPSAPPRRAIALGKAALADNSAALIRLARREWSLGLGYARMVGARAAEAIAGARKPDAEAGPWLDRIAKAHGVEDSFTELSAEAATAKTSQSMLEAARKLYAWKERITRATR